MAKTTTPEIQTEEKRGEWLGALWEMWVRAQNLFWNATGVVVLLWALLVLLGWLGLTGGTWVRLWVKLLRGWFGIGGLLILPFAAWFGLYLLRLPTEHPMRPAWGKVAWWEVAAFSAMGLADLLGGHLLARAESGLDGGRVGWGLTELLRLVAGKSGAEAILGLGVVLGVLGGSGVHLRAAKAIKRWLFPTVGEGVVIGKETVASQNAVPKKRRARKPKPVTPRRAVPIDHAKEEKPKLPANRPPDLPPLTLLEEERADKPDEKHIHLQAGLIEKTLAEFGIPAKVVGVRVGPTVVQFAVEPGYIEKPTPNGEPERQKVRVAQIAALRRDLALALSAERLRVQAPVPGKSYVGIEVPNPRAATVRLRPLLASEAFRRLNSPLALALGRDVSGAPLVADLAKMPHLLIAGATGSGKSVCISAITTCLVLNNSPEQLRLVMIDPKRVELLRFAGLPHILGAVESDPERVLASLQWVVAEMERRYRLLESTHSRHLDSYNAKMRRKGKPTLPYIVVLIDELADLMMFAPEQVEQSLVRLAQMARATGIHLVVATQRPSTDVVTGLIKANFPARLSFAVASGTDSRVILDTPGAEHLLGKGDMLFLPPDAPAPIRAQGAMVSDKELKRVLEWWQKHAEKAETETPWESLLEDAADLPSGYDPLLEKAAAIVIKAQRASASMLQRRLRVGYPRAARLIEQLEEVGVVGPAGAGKERPVLLGPDEEFSLSE